MKLNEEFVPFTEMDLNYLKRWEKEKGKTITLDLHLHHYMHTYIRTLICKWFSIPFPASPVKRFSFSHSLTHSLSISDWLTDWLTQSLNYSLSHSPRDEWDRGYLDLVQSAPLCPLGGDSANAIKEVRTEQYSIQCSKSSFTILSNSNWIQLYYTMLCYIVLCYAMLCYTILCYAVLHCAEYYACTNHRYHNAAHSNTHIRTSLLARHPSYSASSLCQQIRTYLFNLLPLSLSIFINNCVCQTCRLTYSYLSENGPDSFGSKADR